MNTLCIVALPYAVCLQAGHGLRLLSSMQVSMVKPVSHTHFSFCALMTDQLVCQNNLCQWLRSCTEFSLTICCVLCRVGEAVTLCWQLERSPGAASGHDSNTVQYDVTAMVTHHALSLMLCFACVTHVQELSLCYLLLALHFPWLWLIAGMS